MANDVVNSLLINGPKKQLEEIPSLLISTDQNGNRFVDFEAILPTPPELDIEIESQGEDGYKILYGKEEEIRKILSRMKAERGKKFLDDATFLQELRGTDPKMFELGQKYQDNIRKHGAENWMPWRRKHWGTLGVGQYAKYSHKANGQLLEIFFSTSNTIPFPFLKALSKKYPGCRFDLVSDESGNYYHLEATIKNGYVLILENLQQNPLEEFYEEQERSLEEIKATSAPTSSNNLAKLEKVGLNYFYSYNPNLAIPVLEQVLNIGISQCDSDHSGLLEKYENLARAIKMNISYDLTSPELIQKGIDCLKKAINIRFEKKTTDDLKHLYKDYRYISSFYQELGSLDGASLLFKELSENTWEEWEFRTLTEYSNDLGATESFGS